MAGCAVTSIVVGLFDVKHYFHLQLVPHLTRHHQYWRLFLHHSAFSSSSDVFIAELLLYNAGVEIERQFGSVKFASFALVATLTSIILEFISLLLFSRLGLNYIPSGPSALIFAILYQYWRLIPSAYEFRIFGLSLSNKSFVYVLGLQLAVSYMPGSIAVALIGILSGQIYRSELAGLKFYRLPPSLVRMSNRLLLPLIGSTRPPRRSNRALPDEATPSNTTEPPSGSDEASSTHNEEIITTSRTNTRPVRGRSNNPPRESADRELDSATAAPPVSGTSVMREWVNEFTGRSDTINPSIRAPAREEIDSLATLFPAAQRDVLVSVSQRNPNLAATVERLLAGQP